MAVVFDSLRINCSEKQFRQLIAINLIHIIKKIHHETAQATTPMSYSLIFPCGLQEKSRCGYCSGPSSSSSYGIWAYSLTCEVCLCILSLTAFAERFEGLPTPH
jgi:hypothetical protein